MDDRRTPELGVGGLPTGQHNRITDVAGVRVGHRTLRDAGVRTGVTVILPHPANPFRRKAPAGVHVANGHTKAAGLAQVTELGTLESPIAITSTLAVGRVLAGLVGVLAELDPGIGTVADGTVNAVVLECNDARANAARVPAIGERHVAEAVAAASEEVPEGTVGAGAGMTAYGLAAGIGTASRLVEAGGDWTVGALVCANFGRPADLRLGDQHVGPRLAALLDERGAGVADGAAEPHGSVAVVIATDAPLDARQLARLARRGAVGVARTGTPVGHGSGDVSIAFATNALLPHRPAAPQRRVDVLDDTALDPFFAAVADATEESVYRALLAADRRDDATSLAALAGELGLPPADPTADR